MGQLLERDGLYNWISQIRSHRGEYLRKTSSPCILNSSYGEFGFLCVLSVLCGEIRKAQHRVRDGCGLYLEPASIGITEDHREGCRSSPSEAIAFHAVASRLFRIILRFTIYSGGHHASTRGWGTFSVKVGPASGP